MTEWRCTAGEFPHATTVAQMASKGLQLYENLQAYYPARARLMMHEKNLPYESIQLDLFKGGALTPQFLKLNPAGTVPVLVTDGMVITQSLDIVKYLDTLGSRLGESIAPETVAPWVDLIEKWNGNDYMAATGGESFRALFKMIADYNTSICNARMKTFPDMAQVYKDKLASITAPKDEARIQATQEQLKVILEKAESQLAASKFIAGSEYTIADVLLTVALYRVGASGQFSKVTASSPNVVAYYTRMQERPSFNDTYKATCSQRFPIFGVLPGLLRIAFFKLTGC